MDVKTGAILAMASKPDFDPNDPLNFTANEAYLNELVHAEPELTASIKRMPTATTSPMSWATRFWTRKRTIPVTTGISCGRTRPSRSCTTRLCVQGHYLRHGHRLRCGHHEHHLYLLRRLRRSKETYHCAGRKAHGLLNMAEALRKSCNIYYIQLGQRVGSQQFYNYFDAFGFTARTGVDLPSETNFMQYYRADQLGEVQLASSSFGQAMAITPLQMCTAIAATVNGGYLVTPMCG
mgnify:CR=1 FL=1